MMERDAGPAPTGSDFTTLQFISMIVVVCTGFSSQMVMPLWIGAVIDQHSISEAAAGKIASAEFAAVALTSVAIAALLPRLPTRPMTAFGVALLFLGNALAAYVDSASALTAARIITGCGKGIVVAIVFSLCAGTARPTRSFAIINISYALFATGFYLVIPDAIKWKQASGAFLVMSSVALVGALMLFTFPTRRLAAAIPAGAGRGERIPAFGILAMLALILLWLGHAFIWTYLERLGINAGLSVEAVAKVLSLGAVVTIAGPSIARLVDRRFGEIAPVAVAAGGLIVCALAIVFQARPEVYVVATPLFQMLALFTTPYLMGILSAADPRGRLAALSSAAMTAGGSLGSLGGSATVGAFSYPGLALASSAIFCIVIGLMLLVGRPLRTLRRAEADAAALDIVKEAAAP